MRTMRHLLLVLLTLGVAATAHATPGALGITPESSGLPLEGGTLNAGAVIAWSTRSKISSPADGILLMTDAAGTAFTRLDFGGTTSSYPALARNGVTIQVRLADNSLFAAMQASYFTTGAGGHFFDSSGMELSSSGVLSGTANGSGGVSADSSIYRTAAGKWSNGSGTQSSLGVWDDGCFTATGINMNTAAAQSIFTVPTGKVWHWRSVELFDCNATVNTATWTVGCNGAGTDGGFGTMSSVTFNLSATQSHRWFESASSAEGAAGAACMLDIATQEGAGDLCSVRFCGSLEN